MLRFLCLLLSLWGSHVLAQEAPASSMLMTIGPIDGESDGKNSIITIRYETKPGFEKPKVEAHGSFLQLVLPQTLVTHPGQFIEANSPYIRKMAAFQIDENTAGLRLFVTKEAAEFLPAITTDILENRVVLMLNHAIAEKNLIAHFEGAPVSGGPSPEEIVQRTAIRTDIPDPIAVTKGEGALAAATVEKSKAEGLDAKAKKVAPAPDAAPSSWSEGLDQKLVPVTVFVAVMLLLLIVIKSWRNIAARKWPLAPSNDMSLKTLATHTLGPKQKITVVQVGGEQILLGVSADQISFLTSLKKGDAANGLTLEPTHSPLRPQAAVPRRPPSLDDAGSKPLSRSSRGVEKMPEPGSSISYGISDQGVKNFKGQAQPQNRSAADANAMDDVTKLIRKKLRDLPKV